MRIALLTDLHANREALAACLAHAEQQCAQRYAFLGDLVGYGADPGWVIDTVQSYAQQGAIVVTGNHDAAVVQGLRSTMHAEASQAIDWTRARLDAGQLAFLAHLPLTVEENDCLFVHASARQPAQWDYITNARQARDSLSASSRRVIFCGHVHEPALYRMAGNGRMTSLTPHAAGTITLATDQRWLAIPGAVGQPRDGNPAACYAIYDDAAHALRFFRVPYDCAATASKVLAAGLPPRFGQRLLLGL